MAEARAAVERRKASALRSARAASGDAANSFAPFGALPPLIFLEANTSCRSLPKLGCGCIARMRSLFSPLPARGEREQRASREQKMRKHQCPQPAAKNHLNVPTLRNG